MSRLLRLAARCTECGARPRLRIPEAERELSLQQDPDTVKQTYQCHRCGASYEITAKDFHEAA